MPTGVLTNPLKLAKGGRKFKKATHYIILETLNKMVIRELMN